MVEHWKSFNIHTDSITLQKVIPMQKAKLLTFFYPLVKVWPSKCDGCGDSGQWLLKMGHERGPSLEEKLNSKRVVDHYYIVSTAHQMPLWPQGADGGLIKAPSSSLHLQHLVRDTHINYARLRYLWRLLRKMQRCSGKALGSIAWLVAGEGGPKKSDTPDSLMRGCLLQ